MRTGVQKRESGQVYASSYIFAVFLMVDSARDCHAERMIFFWSIFPVFSVYLWFMKEFGVAL